MIADFIGILLIFVLSIFLAWVVGKYLSGVFKGKKTFLDFLQPIENFIFKIANINPTAEMNWKQYIPAVLIINGVWLLYAFVLLLVQGNLPLNPSGNPSMEWTLALNSAISFLTSTNLQHYSGETGATYLSQIAVFTFLQFVSAGTSLAVGVAVVRGLVAGTGQNLGNFYQDFVKSCTRVLMPISLMVAVIFIFKGMPMTFEGSQELITLQGDTVQVARGPVAAMIPIKELGSNGGGYFGTNTAHPFENPDFFTFIIHNIIVFLLPVAFIFMIGFFLNRKKFAWMIFGVMTAGFILLAIPIMYQEVQGNPAIAKMGITQITGNMEGKEIRFGAWYSAFYCAENVVIPAGTLVSMHDSFMPLSGISMLLAMLIDGFYGGIGTGWLNMFIYIIIAVFVGTLMIGRTPEIFGRKVGIPEIQIAIGITVIQPVTYLTFTAIACAVYLNQGNEVLGWLSNPAAHGFTTMLYEYVSSYAGNGSGFEGLGDNTPFWNLTTAFVMLVGRFVPIFGALIIAGLLAEKQYIPPSLGTLKVDSISFNLFLLLVIAIVNALSMFSTLILGPVIDHFQF
ncbi:MAG: potassium-transporting ATPase subunit A [Verrucomicrobia bacterium]|nr:potassium-transporting ATPase subunit A [Cytophagales bacterium]